MKQQQRQVIGAFRTLESDIDRTHNQVLDSFNTLHDQAKHLVEIYSNLKGSIDTVRYFMSICVVKLVGIETIIMVTMCWIFIYYLPRFGYSRLYLSVLLVAEQVRNAYRIFFHGGWWCSSTVLHGLTHLLLCF